MITRYALQQSVAGDIVVKKDYRVVGDLKAKRVRVAGRVLGNIDADELVEVRPAGYVRGNIHASSLIVADGAWLTGHCEIRNPDR